MLHEVSSPLLPLRLGPAPQHALRYLDGLGAAVDVMRQMPWHGCQPIGTMVALLINALRDDRAHFALTDQGTPWGLAVWHWVDHATHTAWLESPPALRQLASQQATQTTADSNSQQQLWFSLLVTPFCASLPLLRQLQARLPQAQQAWAITPYGVANGQMDMDAPPQVRPVW